VVLVFFNPFTASDVNLR